MSTDTTTAAKPDRKQNQIISYYKLRILIGASGICLPLLMIIGKLVYNNSWDIEYSISDYYDNGTAGDLLVGVLFALGFFLFTYKGYAVVDDVASNLGCVFALGVALCPTTSDNKVIHILHFIFAFLLFSVFIFFSIYLFRKSKPGNKTRQKQKRNGAYLICGIIMIICIAAMAIFNIFFAKLSSEWNITFWFESIALVSFGFSWITKAETLFWRDSRVDIQLVPKEGVEEKVEAKV